MVENLTKSPVGKANRASMDVDGKFNSAVGIVKGAFENENNEGYITQGTLKG